jgi:para-nitrobenzyl esterase
MPAAEPLFAQAISESGGAERVWPHALAQEAGSEFASTFRTGTGLQDQAITTAPAALLITAQQRFIAQSPKHFPLRPEIDGHLLTRLPIDTIAAGSAKAKRLLIGTNRDESAFFIGSHPQHDPTASDLGNLAQPTFAPIYGRYVQLYPTMTDEQRRIRALTAEEYWIPSIRVADAHVRCGGRAWMYRFDFEEARGRLANYAAHAQEVGMVWDKPHTGVGNDAAEAALGKQMHTAWSAFICGRTPSAPGLPVWPAYDVDRRLTMILNEESHVESKPQEAELQLWSGLL